MYMFGLMSLLTMAFAVLFIAVCVMTIVRAVVVPAEVRRGSRCGGCGYELSDLTTERCSECGAKLLRVGVTTPAMIVRHRSSGVAAVLAWTSLVGMVGVFTSSFVTMALTSMPFGSYLADSRIKSDSTFSPPMRWRSDATEMPGNDYEIRIKLDVVTDEYAEIESGEIEVEIENSNGEAAIVVIDAVTLTYTIDDETEQQDVAFDESTARQLLQGLGYDPESESIRSEAAQLVALVEAVPDDPLSYGNVLWSSSASNPLRMLSTSPVGTSVMRASGFGGLPEGFGIVMGFVAFWLLVWIVGLVVITSRRKRLFNTAA